MNSALRFKRIKVQHVGVLGDKAIELDGLGPGINVISGPNECGKSSIVRALRAALFQRHGSGQAAIKALRPYGSKHWPSVEVEFELDRVTYLLEKRFGTKGMARVTAGDGSVSLNGDDADRWLIETLDAREAAKKGLHVDDMGVWGLLWVNQDAYATQEPAEAMGDHVRGSLARTIGTLVGNVMGGAYGVALKRALDDRYSLHWTAKQDRATGEFLAAQRRVEELTALVTQLRARCDETTALGDALQVRLEQRAELEAESARLTASLAELEAAVREGEALERHRDAAAEALRDAEAQAESVSTRQATRLLLRQDLRDCEQALETRAEAFARLRLESQRRADVALSTGEREFELRRSVNALVESVSVLHRRIAAQRGRAELATLRARWAEVSALEGVVRTARESLKKLPDTATLDALVALDTRRAEHQDLLARKATQVRVEGASPVAVTQRQTVDLGPLGSITVEPPRDGFLKARDVWMAARTKLLERLAALRVDSVAVARTTADTWQRLTAEVVTVRAALAKVAPEGIEAVARELERVETQRAELLRQRDDATACSEELATRDKALAAFPFGPDEMQTLLEAEAKVKALYDLEDRAAVRLTVRPLAAVRVQLGTREAMRVLTVGTEVRRPVAGPMVLVVEDKVEIEIDPGAVGQSSAEALEAARDALGFALTGVGVTSMDEARAHDRARTTEQSRRDAAAERLAARAPEGLAALVERVEQVSRSAEVLRRRKAQGQTLQDELSAHTAALQALTLGPRELAELDALDRTCLGLEQAMQRLAGRIVEAEGAVGEVLGGEVELVHPRVLEVGDARVEIVPGEGGHDLELPMMERELAGRLKALELATVDEARRAHNTWIAETARLERDEARLRSLAPQGMAGLDAEMVRVETTVGTQAPEAEPLAELERRLSLEQQRHEERRDELATAEARAETARGHAREAQELAAQSERAWIEQNARKDTLAAQLRVSTESEGDDTLREALRAAETALHAAHTRWETAAQACDRASPALRRADRDREAQALADVTRELSLVREACARDKGTLDGRLGEGYHDRTSEAESERTLAVEKLARIEREALAIKLLHETAERAYSEAQNTLMEPVYREAAPLLQIIRPGTTFQMNRDTMQLEQVLRDGFEEDFKDLSGGAREQLAVVVRIALAKVFARQQRALPLILDDILGWTDDRRLRAMLNVLERTAQDLQVLLLTCHPSRFRGLAGAQTYALDALKAGA